MRKRTRAREHALQILYQMEITKDRRPEVIGFFWTQLEENQPGGPVAQETREFTEHIVALAGEKMPEIDKAISDCAEHWEIGRMAVVDRNILRVGVCEILFCEDIPVKVAMNEAIELAKKYGNAESARFVNGILDQVAKRKNSP